MDHETKRQPSVEETTHFGYKPVPVAEKEHKVAEVFHSVAKQYDVMNDLMSLGIHRLWKRIAIHLTGLRAGQQVLDLAGGTGDLAMKLAEKVGKDGNVVLSDINSSMLSIGRDRLINHGLIQGIEYVQANAEALPFASNHFHCVTMAFGLRNVTHKDAALREIFRVLKPGGQLLVLEFSKPVLPGLNKLYDLYSFSLLPWLGEKIAKDRDSYQYLAESIRMHPDQETLKGMMVAAGFENCRYHNLSGGIVALHRGYKF